MSEVQPVKVKLTRPQIQFASAPEQFPAFCGGFGSGKTHAGVARAIAKKLQYPGQDVAYYLPTYDLVKTIGFPRFAESLNGLQLPFKINKSDSVIEVGPWNKIIFRTMDTPERIIGYEVADSIVDELDTLSKEKASDVWNKIVGRNRQKKPDGSLNTVGVCTTPEGFRFVYDRWQRRGGGRYRLITASTYSNAKNLPDGYIDSLKDTYTPELLAAYLEGLFVNLTAGTVYGNYNRKLNNSIEQIKDDDGLHIGMDFNVTKMAAAVHVIRGNDEPHAVDELTKVFDTPAMIAMIKKRYQGQGTERRPITIYPDASGNNRKSVGASQTDISLLTQAGFRVCNNPANPAVRDRILAMNLCFNKQGQRRYRVNAAKCPDYAESLEKQAYDKNGEPDKSGGHDHINDAGGYFIAYRYPITRRTFESEPLSM